jgi:hypothetical protein
MILRINSRRRVSAVKLRSVQPWVLSLRIIEKYLDPVEEPLQNRLEFENRGHFAPGWNLARHRSQFAKTGWSQWVDATLSSEPTFIENKSAG